MTARDLLAAATPRPWRTDPRFPRGIYGKTRAIATAERVGRGRADAALIVAAVNEYEALHDIAEAAGPLARLPYPLSGDERNDWRVHQQHLRDALARLDATRSTP